MNSSCTPQNIIDSLNCQEEYKPIVEELLTKFFRDNDSVSMEIDESRRENKHYPVILFKLSYEETDVSLEILVESGEYRIGVLTIENGFVGLKIIGNTFNCYYVETEKKDRISFEGEFLELFLGLDKAFELCDLLENFQRIIKVSEYSYKDFVQVSLKTLGIANLSELFRYFSISNDIFRMLNGEIRVAKKVTKSYTVWMDYWNDVFYVSDKLSYEISSETQIRSLECKGFVGGPKYIMSLLEEAHSRVLSFLQELAELENARIGQ